MLISLFSMAFAIATLYDNGNTIEFHDNVGNCAQYSSSFHTQLVDKNKNVLKTGCWTLTPDSGVAVLWDGATFMEYYSQKRVKDISHA